MRARDGAITTFDAPGAGTGFLQGTVANNINPAGVIAGWYQDASNVTHGFVRAPNGAITKFDAPGAGTAPGQGTSTAQNCLNPAGAIAGTYADASNVTHGFVRAPNGAITKFDAPGAGTGLFQGTSAMGINPGGAVKGGYADASNVVHGFVRGPSGVIATFDAPGAGKGAFQGTQGTAINPGGTIMGIYVDASNVHHGFVRAPNGAITTFERTKIFFSLGAATAPMLGPTRARKARCRPERPPPAKIPLFVAAANLSRLSGHGSRCPLRRKLCLEIVLALSPRGPGRCERLLPQAK